MIIVAGGVEDPNISALVQSLRQSGSEVYPFLVGRNSHPQLTWDLTVDQLMVNGEVIKPEAVFIRHDVFSSFSDPRPEVAARAYGWYTAVSAWALAHENVRLFNRKWSQRLSNKPLHLYLAQKAGLKVPETLITNALSILDELLLQKPLVAKPINGGGYCQELKPLLEETERINGLAAMPAIVQTHLILPEIRIYGIGGKFFPFTISSNALDYRTTDNCTVEIMDHVPQELVNGLKRLMEKLGMDFGAADFKSCPETGQLLFLEINSSPMFSRFNYVSNGALCNAMKDFLQNK